MSELRGVKLLDNNNVPILTSLGALKVDISSIHNAIVNSTFHLHTGVSTTISVVTIINATSFTVVSVTGFAIGNYIQIGGHESLDAAFTKITNIVGNVITINRPLGYPRAIGTTIQQITINMATTAGTLAAPIKYQIVPSTGYIWHIEQLAVELDHSTAGDIGLFGNLNPLANGCVLRKYNGLTGNFDTFDVWTTNADIFLDFANIQFLSRSGGGGTFSTIAVGSFNAIGVTVRLDGTAGDYLEIVIQDNLTTLSGFKIKGQGYLEGV